jgi:heme/copper-type cytochrome/quinol oxidase subunit 3
MYWLDNLARGRGWLAGRRGKALAAWWGVGPDARKRDRWAIVLMLGFAAMTLVGVGSFALRLYEFPGLRFHWSDNAYASTVWALLVLHLFYIVLAAGEVGILAVWLFLHGLDEKHAVDATLTAGYWYWTAGTVAVIYAVVYWVPRVL